MGTTARFAALGGVLIGLTGCFHQGTAGLTGDGLQPSAHQTATTTCDSTIPTVQPITIVLDCANDDAQLLEVHWSHWGTTSATGTANYEQNTCAPSCQSGNYTPEDPVKVTLVDPVAGAHHLRYFSIALVHFDGASPNGRTTETFPLQVP